MMQEYAGLKREAAAWIAAQPGEGRADRSMRLIVAAVVLVFPAACLLVSRSDSYCLFLLLVIGLTSWARASFRTGFSRRDWLYVSVFFGFFVAGVLAFELGHQTDYGFRLLGRYIRLLLVFPALIAFKRYRPPALLVWAGLGAGALVLGVDAVWERVDIQGFLQPDGDTNVAILFGDFATLTTFAFAAGYLYVDTRLPRLGPKFMWLGILAGFIACFLSGARGAWLAVPVLLILFLSCRHWLRPRAVLLGGVLIVALFGILYAVPQSKVRERLDDALDQLRTYAYVRHSLEAAPAPFCMDDPVLLQAWAAAGIRSHDPRLQVSVAPAAPAHIPLLLARHGCRQGMVLRLVNDANHPNWLYLPHSTRTGHGPAVAQVLVVGRGQLHLGQGAHAHQLVSQRIFRGARLYTLPKLGERLSVAVAARATLRLVPLERYTGEYRYAILQSSVGQRLEMWGVAGTLFREAPWTGVGTGAYIMAAQQLVDEGAAPPITAIYDHPHNEVMDALSSRGLVGLAALLLLFGVPGWLFARGLSSPDAARMGAAMGGLMVVVGMVMCGLSETMLVHSITLGWYVIMTALFMVTAEKTQEPRA
jgi:O-antigen ligase